MSQTDPINEGILLVDKPTGVTSFSLVSAIRRSLDIRKVGHSGTLDPLASGLMVMLVGRNYTRLSDKLLTQDKAYTATIKLGEQTDSYDSDGMILASCSHQPTEEAVLNTLEGFQGHQLQIPPMFSAKKKGGRKLYELARKGEVVERDPVSVEMHIRFLSYEYPYLAIHVHCTKGTYIRSLAHDIGVTLACGGHLTSLRRTQSGSFYVKDAIPADLLKHETADKVREALTKSTAIWRATGAV